VSSPVLCTQTKNYAASGSSAFHLFSDFSSPVCSYPGCWEQGGDVKSMCCRMKWHLSPSFHLMCALCLFWHFGSMLISWDPHLPMGSCTSWWSLQFSWTGHFLTLMRVSIFKLYVHMCVPTCWQGTADGHFVHECSIAFCSCCEDISRPIFQNMEYFRYLSQEQSEWSVSDVN